MQKYTVNSEIIKQKYLTFPLFVWPSVGFTTQDSRLFPLFKSWGITDFLLSEGHKYHLVHTWCCQLANSLYKHLYHLWTQQKNVHLCVIHKIIQYILLLQDSFIWMPKLQNVVQVVQWTKGLAVQIPPHSSLSLCCWARHLYWLPHFHPSAPYRAAVATRSLPAPVCDSNLDIGLGILKKFLINPRYPYYYHS